MAGKWAYVREDYAGGKAQICTGLYRDGGAVDQRDVEPWFAPGTTITLVGNAASTSTTGLVSVNGNWRLTFSFENGDAILVDYQDYH